MSLFFLKLMTAGIAFLLVFSSRKLTKMYFEVMRLYHLPLANISDGISGGRSSLAAIAL